LDQVTKSAKAAEVSAKISNDAESVDDSVESSATSSKPSPTIEGIEQSINEAAKGVNASWLALLFLMAYIFVATGKVTHKDLFLESPVRLPLLAVDVPLRAYFALTPALLLALHFYFSIQFSGLAAKFAEYNYLIPDDISGERLRLRLHNSLFAQFLGGPRGLFGSTNEIYEVLNGVVVWITVSAAPAWLILFIQLQYLPQQDPSVTWWHKLAVIADIVIIALFILPIAQRRYIFPISRRFRKVVFGCIGASFACLLLFSLILAEFPGEGVFPGWTSSWLSSGADNITEAPASWFSNRLILPDVNLVEGVDLTKSRISRSVRGRRFELAIFDRSDMRQIDFTGAKMKFASFKGAKLQNAIMSCAYENAFEPGTESAGPIGCPDFRQVSFEGADLRGASAVNAIMYGASFNGARLDAANMVGAQLQGADFTNASCVAADLTFAGLDGASLRYAKLTGVSLANARLRGSDLSFGQLFGASLEGAQAQNASFEGAQLQGALMRSARFTRANFSGSAVYATDVTSSDFTDARIENVLRDRRFKPDYGYSEYVVGHPDAFATTGDSVAGFTPGYREPDISSPQYFEQYLPIPDNETERIAMFLGDLTDVQRTPVLIERFSRLAPDIPTPDWLALVPKSATEDFYRAGLANRLLTIACTRAGGIYVPIGMFRNGLLCPFEAQVDATLHSNTKPDGILCENAAGLRFSRHPFPATDTCRSK